MADAYELDPYILENFEPDRRRSAKAGIGIGKPISFPFTKGQNLEENWEIKNTTWNFAPQDGFLRCSAGGQFATLEINKPFSLTNANVTVAFGLRLNLANARGDSFIITLPNGIELKWLWNDGSGLEPVGNYYYNNQRIGASKITWTDAVKWHRIVITTHGDEALIWEVGEADDLHYKVTLNTAPSEVHARFDFSHGWNDGPLWVDIEDVTALIGLDRPGKAKRGMGESTISAFPQTHPLLKGMTSSVKATSKMDDVTSIIQDISQIHVGPGALFWGVSVSPQLKAKTKALWETSHIQSLIRNVPVASLPIVGGPTFYLGISVTAEFFISGSLGIGFLMSKNNSYLVAPATLGAASNVGASVTIDLGIYPRLSTEQLLYWGNYVQASGGEFVQVSVGVAGTSIWPLHLLEGPRQWDNCGLTFSVGIGASVLPADIGAGGSYTFELAKL